MYAAEARWAPVHAVKSKISALARMPTCYIQISTDAAISSPLGGDLALAPRQVVVYWMLTVEDCLAAFLPGLNRRTLSEVAHLTPHAGPFAKAKPSGLAVRLRSS